MSSTKSTGEVEISLLCKIQSIYREIILNGDLDYYFLKEQELENLFSEVSSLELNSTSTDERKSLLEDIHSMNLEIIQLVQIEKGKMEQSEKVIKRYYPPQPLFASAFFDQKG